MEQKFDLCIAGAGMAGATMAGFLAPKGCKIALIDKDFDFKDRIVAELLQPGAVNLFKEMGLGSCLEGFDAQEVYGYAMMKDGDAFQIPYNEDGSKTQVGIGVNSGLFLQNIRAYLRTFDNVTFIKGSVTELRKDGETIVGATYYDNEKEEQFDVDAKLTIASDGFYSRLRKTLSDNEVSITSHFIGVLMKNVDLPFPNHGHLFLSGPTPFVCYPISSTEIRCLVDFPSDIPPRRGPQINDHLVKNVIPYLPEEVKPAFINAYKKGKFKVMANQLMPAKPKK
ncbi:MAG: squalene monooxygenase, partial [Planctomycetota bacterium]